MKYKLLLINAILAMFLFVIPVFASDTFFKNGICGDNMTWTLSDDGMLTISGNGNMWSYGHDYFAPWHSFRGMIKAAELSEGIEGVGKYAFSECLSLESIKIPQSVKSFGENAFYGCTSLSRVDISSVESWCKAEFLTRDANPMVHGAYLYLNGSLLEDIVVPESVTEIYSYAFVNCKNTANVFIPDSVKGTSYLTFDGCSGFTISGFEGSAAQKYASENDIPFIAVKESSTGVGERVKVSIPPFKVSVLGKEFDSTYARYPMLFYKDITYYPLTYAASRNAGIAADFTLERGLELCKTEEIGSYPNELSKEKNSTELYANIAAGTIRVNGNRIYNTAREYPFLIFRDITYLPLTWELARGYFGRNYHFDTTNGLVISR